MFSNCDFSLLLTLLSRSQEERDNSDYVLKETHKRRMREDMAISSSFSLFNFCVACHLFFGALLNSWGKLVLLLQVTCFIYFSVRLILTFITLWCSRNYYCPHFQMRNLRCDVQQSASVTKLLSGGDKTQMEPKCNHWIYITQGTPVLNWFLNQKNLSGSPGFSIYYPYELGHTLVSWPVQCE